MPNVTIHLPFQLADALGVRTLDVSAATLADVLGRLRADHPRAATHVFDDLGHQRRHVLIFLNDRDTRHIPDHAAVVLAANDRLSIVQAISGG